jgi:lipooligosaccharide transport system permease protein
MFTASFSMTYGTYIKMRYQKTFEAIISTPISIDSVILGEILWGATAGFIDGVIIFVVTSIFRLPAFPVSLLLLPLCFLFGIVFSILGILASGLIKHIEQFDYYFNCFVSLMFLFSGTFFPLTRMPQIVQKFAWFLPLTHGIKIMRPLFLGTVESRMFLHLIWLVGLIAVLFPLVLVRLRSQILKYS